MPLPVRPLPVLQNWDCGGCSNCCRTYNVRVSEAEQAALSELTWDDASFLKGQPPTVYDKSMKSQRLSHTDDSVCIFLGPDNRCRIHARFGSAAKPLACRLFPFMLIPAGDHWRVGLRYSCPETTADRGRPLASHLDDLREYARIQESDVGRPPPDDAPPPLKPGQSVSWPDLLRFVSALSNLLATPDRPMEFKLRTLLNLIALLRRSSFEKVTGHRLSEFLDVVSAATMEDTIADPAKIRRPGWVGRSLFRQVAAVFTRKDVGLFHGDLVRRGILGRLRAAWKFAIGRGRIPSVHAAIPPDATYEAAEQPQGPFSAKSEALLTRYYRLKLESLQFCGRANFRMNVWDGLESLVLTFPVVMWLSRILTSGRTREEALELAIRIVDDNFGFNPLLGSVRQTVIVGFIRAKDELPRLVAWYGR